MTNLTKVLAVTTGVNTILGITNLVLYNKTKKKHEKYLGTLSGMYTNMEKLIIEEGDK